MRSVKYELKNTLGNPATIIFGFLFPLVFAVFISNSLVKDFPDNLKNIIGTSVILSISVIIPMAICLIGYNAVYAQEVEKNIPLRLSLFGISSRELFKGKVLSQGIIVVVCTLSYFIIMKLASKYMEAPSLLGLLRYILINFILCAIFIALSHGIANLTKKFGPSYAIVMGLYFLFMFLGGMMGPRYEDFSPLIQKIAMLLPTTVFGRDSYYIWKDANYNWGPMIQSFLFTASLAFLVLIISIRRENRRRL